MASIKTLIPAPNCPICQGRQGQAPGYYRGSSAGSTEPATTVCKPHRLQFQANYNTSNPDNPLIMLKSADLSRYHNTISDYISHLLNQTVEIDQFYQDCRSVSGAIYLPQDLSVYHKAEIAQIEQTVVKLQRYRHIAKTYHCAPIKLPQVASMASQRPEILTWSRSQPWLAPPALDNVVIKVNPAQSVLDYLQSLVASKDLPRLYQSLQAAYQTVYSAYSPIRRHHVTVLTGTNHQLKLDFLEVLKEVLGQQYVKIVDWSYKAHKIKSYNSETKTALVRKYQGLTNLSNWTQLVSGPPSIWLVLPVGLGLPEEIEMGLGVGTPTKPVISSDYLDFKAFLINLAMRERW